MAGKTDIEIKLERLDIIKKISKLYPNAKVIPSYFEKEKLQDPITMLGKSIQLMAGANLIVFAKGWEKARGCLIEKEVAEKYHISYMFL